MNVMAIKKTASLARRRFGARASPARGGIENRARRGFTGAKCLCAASLAVFAAAFPFSAFAIQPYNMPVGVTDISREVFDLHMLIYWICVAIGVVVFGAMLYSMIRHRKACGHEAAQFHESTTAEIAWTIVPLLILIAMAVASAKVLIKMENVSEADMTVKITGYQWMWHYDYLEDDIDFYSVLATPREQIYDLQRKGEHYLLEVDKELVLPVGRKVRFLITSNDVLHAWWVPDLAVKKDAIPGFINESWTKINEPGVYRGQCAELCGRDHAFMPIVVRALPEEEYRRWVADTKAGGQPVAMSPVAGVEQGANGARPQVREGAGGVRPRVNEGAGNAHSHIYQGRVQ